MPLKQNRKSRRLQSLHHYDNDEMSLSSHQAESSELKRLKEDFELLKLRSVEAEKELEQLRAAHVSAKSSQESVSSTPYTSPFGFLNADTPSKPAAEKQPKACPSQAKLAPKLDVPLPRQGEFDGTKSWEGFVRPLMGLAEACGWSEEEKHFRLVSSLRGKAAEYVFQQLDAEAVKSFDTLVKELGKRFGDRQLPNSYIAQLEARKLQPKEKLAEFVADIRRLVSRGYPTADQITRETIALRHFLKGLPDQQMAVSVGMTTPKSLEDATTAVENFLSLRDNVGSGKAHRINTVQAASPPQKSATNTGTTKKQEFVTQQQMKQFQDNLDRRFAGLAKLIKGDKSPRQPNTGATTKPATAPSGGKAKSVPGSKPADVTCYSCGLPGHFANKCPNLAAKDVVVVEPATEN